MQRTGIIYALFCPISGDPKYIGKTSRDIKTRLSEHKSAKRKNKLKAWLTSLESKGLRPSIEAIDEVPAEEIDFWEMHYISLYKSFGFDLKNMTIGGDGLVYGFRHSEATKKKMSESQKGKRIGRKHTEATKKKLSEKAKLRTPRIGNSPSEETKKKISASLKGRFIGRKLSREAIEKKIKSQTGKKRSPEARMNMSLAQKAYQARIKEAQYN